MVEENTGKYSPLIRFYEEKSEQGIKDYERRELERNFEFPKVIIFYEEKAEQGIKDYERRELERNFEFPKVYDVQLYYERGIRGDRN